MAKDARYVKSVVASMYVSNTTCNGEPRELLLRGSEECEKCLSQLKALGVIGVNFVIQQFDGGDTNSIPGKTYFAKGVRKCAWLIAKVIHLRCLLSASLEDALRESFDETDANGVEMVAKCHVEQEAEGWSINVYVYTFTSGPCFSGIGIKLM